MIKIAIHGTKGGYHILTGERLTDLPYATADTTKDAAIGHMAYSIYFSTDNCVFSKYKIIRDVVGEKRTGNIAFSIIISHSNKLSGADTRALLDRLCNEYCEKYKYIVNNNLDNVREDWSFVDVAAREYESRLKDVLSDDSRIYQSNTADPAFLYYSTNDKLEEFLDAPYQEEYSKYKQIFFVNKELEDRPENPLNALRHNPAANLTDKIDPQNIPFTLVFSAHTKSGVTIRVQANGITRLNGDRVRRNDELDIEYSRQYFNTKNEKGKLDELVRADVVEVDDSVRTVAIKDKELKPKSLEITLELKDKNGELVSGAEIAYKGYNSVQWESIIGNKISFYGEELNERWVVVARKDNLESRWPPFFVPKEQEDKVLLLVLEEQKTTNTQVKNYYKKGNEIDSTPQGRSGSKRYSIGKIFANIPPYMIWISGIAGTVIGAIIIIMVVDSIRGKPHDETAGMIHHIMQYADGIELNLDTLNQFKRDYCRPVEDMPKGNGSSWWEQLPGLSKGIEPTITTPDSFAKKIENAIAIRKFIRSGSIDSLSILPYSQVQSFFKEKVNDIDLSLRDEIGNAMRQFKLLDTMNLIAVSTFITKCQKLLKVRDTVRKSTDIEFLKNEKNEIDDMNFPVKSMSASIEEEIDRRINEIKSLLNKGPGIYNPPGREGSNIEQPNGADAQEGNLEKDFFKLIQGGNTQKDDYNNLLRIHKNEMGEVFDYLKTICGSSDAFREFKEKLKRIPAIYREKIQTLTVLEEKLK